MAVRPLKESTKQYMKFELRKLREAVEKAEKQGHKREWESDEIWRRYHTIVGRILIGHQRTEAEGLMSRAKRVPTI